jgi:hypothetical protein
MNKIKKALILLSALSALSLGLFVTSSGLADYYLCGSINP